MMGRHGGNVARAVGAKHNVLKEHEMPSGFLETMGASGVMTDRPHEETLFRLRSAERDDCPLMLALYLEGAQKHLSKIGRWDEERLIGLFRKGYKLHQMQIICVDNRDVGFIQVIEYPDRLYLRQIHLIDGFRGRGIGSKLIEAQLKRAAISAKPLTLEVLHGNPAKRLYLRLGFKITGQDPDKEHMIWNPPKK
jgi:ribosomal protein S18 acetylase RimI-like enzyme